MDDQTIKENLINIHDKCIYLWSMLTDTSDPRERASLENMGKYTLELTNQIRRLIDNIDNEQFIADRSPEEGQADLDRGQQLAHQQSPR